MPADPKLLSAVRRANLEGALLAMLVEAMNVHGADAFTATISLGEDHEPAVIDLAYEREGLPVAGESL
jgi:hypothetical protein